MTEEEAKTKWCPFARVAKRDIPGRSYNRWADDWSPAGAVDGAKCIGSACMAWRAYQTVGWALTFDAWMKAGNWVEAIKLYRNETGTGLKEAKDYVDSIRGGGTPMPKPEPSGFCGLAGKP